MSEQQPKPTSKTVHIYAVCRVPVKDIPAHLSDAEAVREAMGRVDLGALVSGGRGEYADEVIDALIDDMLDGSPVASRVITEWEGRPCTIRDVHANPGQVEGAPPLTAPTYAWKDYPGHPVEEWRQEVESDATRLGYLAWIQARMDESQADDTCRTCGGPGANEDDSYDGECPDCADKTDERLNREHE